MDPFFVSPGVGVRGSSTALVVNTDPRVLQAFAQAIRSEGYSVLEATSFEEGRDLWKASKPDILVADIRLGQFNGLQLLMRARSDRPDVQAIITCPFADPVLEAETRRFGATFLIRPVEPHQIVQALGKRSVTEPAPIAPIPERRRTERRQMVVADFQPERRVSNRRNDAQGDQRNIVKPDFPSSRPGSSRGGVGL